MMSGCAPKHELVVMSPTKVMVSSRNLQMQRVVPRNNVWKKFKPFATKKKNASKEACLDCYAAPIKNSLSSSVSKRKKSRTLKENSFNVSTNRYGSSVDYSLPPSVNQKRLVENMERVLTRSSYKNRTSDTKYYGSYSYTEKASDTIASTESYESKSKQYLLPVVSAINNDYDSFSTNASLSIQVGAFRRYAGAKRYERRYSALSSKYRTTIKTGKKDNKPIYRVQIEGFKSKMEAKRFMNSYSIEGAFLVRR